MRAGHVCWQFECAGPPASLSSAVRRMHAYDSPEGRANVAAIESQLAELDDMFLQFCSRQGYTFSPIVQLWPRRRVWRRQEVDRCMDLTMEIGVQEVLDRGFCPELL